MKFIKKVIVLLLAVFLGFWLGFSGILNGTKIGNVMEKTVSYLPNSNEVRRFKTSTVPLFDDLIQSNSSTVNENPETNSSITGEHPDVDYANVEETIIRLVNELRQELNLPILESNDMLKAAAMMRAKETEESFSHTRPNGLDAFSIFEEEGIEYNYQRAGENLGMATYYMSEEEMAELIFEGWVESEGHYKNMVLPDYEEIGIGVHYDGEFLYATQIFGTHQ